jgi:hypothetical protein
MISRQMPEIKDDETCCCYCYNAESKDSRCCGICYCYDRCKKYCLCEIFDVCCCPPPNNNAPTSNAPTSNKGEEINKRFDWCPINFTAYWDSCYVQTTSGYGRSAEEKNDVCCWFCFFPKLGMFFPCFLGSICNGCINGLRDTKTNYLF